MGAGGVGWTAPTLPSLAALRAAAASALVGAPLVPSSPRYLRLALAVARLSMMNAWMMSRTSRRHVMTASAMVITSGVHTMT